MFEGICYVSPVPVYTDFNQTDILSFMQRNLASDVIRLGRI